MGGEKNRMLCSRRCICSVYLWHLSATTCICSAYLPPIVVLTSHQSMLNAATKIFIWICTFQKNWSAMCSCCPILYVMALYLLSINHVLHFYKRNDYIYATVAPHHLLHFFQRKQSSLRLPRIIFCTFSKETIFYAAAPHHQTIKDLMTSGATKFIIVAHTLKYKIWSKRQLIFELKK